LPPRPFTTILGSAVALLLVLSLLAKADAKVLLALRATGIGLLYLFWLKDTPFGFEGMFGDNHYYTLAIEKFFYSWAPDSHEYAGIHFALPPLYFGLIGRLGALAHVPLLALLKYSSYLFVIYLPYVWGWSLGPVLGEKKWLAAFVLALLVPMKNPIEEYGSLAFMAQKGWHFLGTFAVVAWYLWVRQKRPAWWKAGLVAGVIFATDFAPFLFLFAAILFELAELAWREPGTMGPRLRAAARRFGYYAGIGCVTLALNLIWIVPVARDVLTHPRGTYFNNYFAYTEGHASLFQSLAILSPFDLMSLVFLAALFNLFVNLATRPETDDLRRMFYAILGFVLLFYGLSFLRFTLLMHHVSFYLLHLLAFSAVLLALKYEGLRWFRPLLALLVIVSLHTLSDNPQNDYALRYSIESTQRYQAGAALRKAHDFRNQIIFPTTGELFYGSNTFSFITADFFSDVAASFEHRLEYIRTLHAMKERGDRRGFFAGLKRTPWGHIQYVILENGRDGELFFSVNAYHNDLKVFRDRRKFFRFTAADFPPSYCRQIYRDRLFTVFQLL